MRRAGVAGAAAPGNGAARGGPARMNGARPPEARAYPGNRPSPGRQGPRRQGPGRQGPGSRDAAAAGGWPPAPGQPRPVPPLFRWIGRVPTAGAMVIFFGAAIAGAIGTAASNRDPGFLLGFMIIAGSVIAALCIRRKAVYLLIPLPALTYLVLAFVTGYAHDRALGTSKTALASDGAQWLGNGFLAIVVATVLVLIIFGARLLASRQLVSGQFAVSGQRMPGRPARASAPVTLVGRGPRGDRPPWDSADSRPDDRAGRDSRGNGRLRGGLDAGAGRGRSSGQGTPGGGRDQRGERDPWYERPRSADRGDRQRPRAVPPGRAPRRDDDGTWGG
jgi:hypothetical protein